MKKFKTILSIALICVLTLGGGTLLTGCKNKTSNPEPADIRMEEIYMKKTGPISISQDGAFSCHYIIFSDDNRLYYYWEDILNNEAAPNLFTVYETIIENGEQFTYDSKIIDNVKIYYSEIVDNGETRSIEVTVNSKNEIQVEYLNTYTNVNFILPFNYCAIK